jgi:hypothetical protein
MNSPSKTRSLSLARQAAKRRARERTRFNALVSQVLFASMQNKLPPHLKSPKKNKHKK